MTEVFPVARMSPVIRGLTYAIFPLPALFLGIGLLGDTPARPIMLGVGLALVALWLGIWVYARPSRFEIDCAELRIVWPIRRARISRRDVASAKVVDLPGFRADFGQPVRIGAGGLFGTFGWLWGPRAGLLDVYVTNLGPWVVVERRAGRPLIISPADPEGFLRALGESPDPAGRAV